MDADTFTTETKKTDGSYHSTGQARVSGDGKTMTVTSKGTNAEGKPSLPPTFTRSSSQNFRFLRVFSGAKKAQMASFRSSISSPPRRTPRRRTAGHAHATRPSLGGRARTASERSWVAAFIELLSSRSRVRGAGHRARRRRCVDESDLSILGHP